LASKSSIKPPNPEASNSAPGKVNGLIPLVPSRRDWQKGSLPMPIGLTTPIPVMTTSHCSFIVSVRNSWCATYLGRLGPRDVRCAVLATRIRYQFARIEHGGSIGGSNWWFKEAFDCATICPESEGVSGEKLLRWQRSWVAQLTSSGKSGKQFQDQGCHWSRSKIRYVL